MIVAKTVLTLVLGVVLIGLASTAQAAVPPPPPPPPPAVLPATAPDSPTCTVPDVRRKLVRDAIRVLTKVGCTSVKTTRVPSVRVPLNRVIAQSVRPGTTIDAKTTVRLHVSAGRR